MTAGARRRSGSALRTPAADPGRTRAARNHRPRHIRLLLVSAAPPAEAALDFYSEADAASAEPLFAGVAHVLFEADGAPDRVAALKTLRRRGVFVAHLAPTREMPLSESAQWLPLRLEELAPDKVILIGTAVYDAAHAVLERAGAPLVLKRVPEPTVGNRVEFARELRTAIVRAGLEHLIRPLPAVK